jgi:hypothetical protein
MQRIRVVLSTMALLHSFPAAGQKPAGFSGVWQMDASRSESAHQAAPIGRVTLIIKQSPSELTIDTKRSGADGKAASSEILTYSLDGTERPVAGSSGATVKAKARWDGNKLITETARDVQGSTVTTVYVFSLDASGKELTVDKTLTVQHGYQFQGATNTGTGRDVFIRSKGSVHR